MMTLDEAITHCQEKACDNTECALEHKELASWLMELKERRNNDDDGDGETIRQALITYFENPSIADNELCYINPNLTTDKVLDYLKKI